MKPFSFLFPLAASAAVPTPPAPPATPPTSATAPSNSQWTFKNGASEIEIQTEGKVTFDADSAALYDLHGDGSLRVRERDGKDVRLLTAKGDKLSWTVNGTARPFDAEGKAWLRGILKARPATPAPPKTPAPPRK